MTDIIHTEYEHCMLALCDHLHEMISTLKQADQHDENLEYLAFCVDQHLIQSVQIKTATLNDLRNMYAKTQDIDNDERYDIHLMTFRLINRIHTHL